MKEENISEEDKALQAEGSLHLQDLDLRGPEKALEIPASLDVSFSLPEVADGNLSAADLQIRAAGLSLQTRGALQWENGTLDLSLEAPRVEISDFRPLLYFLPPDTEITGQCSLSAGALSLKTGNGTRSSASRTPFHLRLPGNLVLEAFNAQIAQGRVRTSFRKGVLVDLAGLRASVTQGSGRQWSGRLEATASEIGRSPRQGGTGTPGEDGEPAPYLSGPFSLQWKWSEEEKASHAVVVADLSGGTAVYRKILDKPAGVPLQAGGRVRFEPDEIRVGRAFLLLGETEWTLSGLLKNPGDPLLEAHLTSGTVSLDRLAEFSPAAREHDVRGLLEIKDLQVKGRTGKFMETATLQARVAGKNLEYNRTSIKEGYVKAVYGKQILTVSPLIIHPGQGRVEATFTGDFSGAFRERGRRQYYGTARVENVNLDKIVTIAHREYSGRVSGTLDANLACRGSGMTWQEIRHDLEARARVYLKNFRIQGDSGQKLVARLAPGDAPGISPDSVNREARRLLSGNNASALVSLKNETLRVRNLAATYEGKVVEMDGTLDFSGRLQVDPGRLYLKNRMIPFHLDCRLGQGRCVPSPDLKVMGKSAFQEMYKGLSTLSSGSRDVFQDLLF
jgi:hypothetical protein